MTPMEELNALLASLPGYALLTDAMKQKALDGALIPDSAGVWPGDPAYVPTYDVYWAALSLLGFLQAQPVVRQTSSEGTSVAVDAPDWSGLASWFRSMSVIAGASSAGPLLKRVRIPESRHIVRTDMSGRYGDVDVDTDLG